MEEEQDHYVEQVVSMEALLTITAGGWSVVERIEYDAPIEFMEETQQQTPPGTYAPTVQVRRCSVGKSVAFRVRKSGTDMVAQFSSEVATLQTSNYRLEQLARENEQRLADEKTGHDRTRTRFNTLSADHTTLTTRLSNVEAARRKLEVDLGKVREAIGRKAFEEIVPPAPPKPEGGV